MKKSLKIALTLAIITLTTGCQETQTAKPQVKESQAIRQLKLEKAQITEELSKKIAELEEKVADQAQIISNQEETIAQKAQSEEGYGKILIDTVSELEKCKAEKAELEKQIAQLKKQLAPKQQPSKEETMKKLEAIKKLQQKAADQMKETK